MQKFSSVWRCMMALLAASILLPVGALGGLGLICMGDSGLSGDGCRASRVPVAVDARDDFESGIESSSFCVSKLLKLCRDSWSGCLFSALLLALLVGVTDAECSSILSIPAAVPAYAFSKSFSWARARRSKCCARCCRCSSSSRWVAVPMDLLATDCDVLSANAAESFLSQASHSLCSFFDKPPSSTVPVPTVPVPKVPLSVELSKVLSKLAPSSSLKRSPSSDLSSKL
mmetsp:Transcript_6386/g.17820  ORF Transcript_6386/g.17820 Transcript_6386/m.17820 type:complete len:229 (+) Transcript_6386:1607-2293(+)